jgi:hypothetical protein
MVHQRKRLALGLEAGDDLGAIHAGFDDLQGHPATHRFLLLGHPDRPHATLADLLEQLVGADARAGAFGRQSGWRGSTCRFRSRERVERRLLQETAGLIVSLEQGRDALPQIDIAAACAVEDSGPVGRRQLHGLEKYRLNAFRITGHGLVLRGGSPSHATFGCKPVERK